MDHEQTDSVYKVLLDIREDIGGLRSSYISLNDKLLTQAGNDDLIESRLRVVELEAAQARGSAKVWGIVGAALSTVLGAAAGFFGGRQG